MTQSPATLCPYCGQPTRILHVHGHGQCERCGTTIDECCRGEQAQDDDPLEPADDD